MSKGKLTKKISTKLDKTSDKENIRPLMEREDAQAFSSSKNSTKIGGLVNRNHNLLERKDPNASSSLANMIPDESLTRVRQKTTARVAPLNIPSSISTSSSLSPTAEEFHLPPHVYALPSDDLSYRLSSLALSPPYSPPFPPGSHNPHGGVTAIVERPGFISLKLRHGVVLDLSSTQAIRLKNIAKDSTISLSACTTQMAMVHPKGRVLQYGPRVEIQAEDNISVKNAKIYPRGISFTANNMALVYLLDEAGARSTSDMFHDLHATHIADMLFKESCDREGEAVTASIDQLDKAKYWRTENGIDCWVIGQVYIRQMEDGLVTVQREVQGSTFILRTSPSNGKVRFDSRFLAVTASLGLEAHMFLRSRDRRLHYGGETKVFTVRNAGHSAGFDEEGSLRIF